MLALQPRQLDKIGGKIDTYNPFPLLLFKLVFCTGVGCEEIARAENNVPTIARYLGTGSGAGGGASGGRGSSTGCWAGSGAGFGASCRASGRASCGAGSRASGGASRIRTRTSSGTRPTSTSTAGRASTQSQ
jgi:hypothetical protein